MTGNRLANFHQSSPSKRIQRSHRDIPRAQETIYNHLLQIVKEWQPEDVLEEFRHLFIHHVNTVSSQVIPSLYEIVFANQEQEFRNTLKRSCYILINNWDLNRNYRYIQELLQLFSDPIVSRPTMSPTLQRLRNWIRAFTESKDFQELKLFVARYDNRETIHWSERYASYLLVPQFINLNNPIEQRQAARTLSTQLKEKFKFDLAMYTARSEKSSVKEHLLNPTALGDDVLRLVKVILARRGVFSYPNLANIFINQTRNLNYKAFKQSLQKYLIFSDDQNGYAQTLRSQLTEKLKQLYTKYDDKPIDDALLLRTCNRLIEYLTTENHREPSSLFILVLSHGNPLTLVIVLLKLILICGYARTHLEARIADLIGYYQSQTEEECQWVVNFFEIFRVTMAIYTENVEFSLINVNSTNGQATSANGQSGRPAYVTKNALQDSLEAYRIFSQHKRVTEADQPEKLDDLLLEPVEDALEDSTEGM